MGPRVCVFLVLCDCIWNAPASLIVFDDTGSLGYPPSVLTVVTASRFLAGNRETELKPSIFYSLLLFHVFLYFLFSLILELSILFHCHTTENRHKQSFVQHPCTFKLQTPSIWWDLQLSSQSSYYTRHHLCPIHPKLKLNIWTLTFTPIAPHPHKSLTPIPPPHLTPLPC